jgi:MFS family permease
MNGLVYMLFAWFGGRFAQRHGYYQALFLGFALMALAVIFGSQTKTAAGVYLMAVLWTLGMCFTWPTLEALVSEGESPTGLQRMVGIYNVVWAGASALAYLVGGTLLDWLSMKSLFWLPLAMHLEQLALLAVLKWMPPELAPSRAALSEPSPQPAQSQGQVASRNPRVFLRIAWAANPFAYVAINTVIAMMPDLAARLQLSLMWVGIFCSLWFFARLTAFVGLWLWPGWHYRFRWLLGAFCLVLVSFLLLLLVQNRAVIILAQIIFGLSVGLIYYSSLFYSMDVGETKGEHGGVHESAIGAGIFVGPAIGATALHFFPHHPASGPWAVSALLAAGAVLIVAIRTNSK